MSPGLYIHVPFCRSKCPYCAFYSIPSPSLIPLWWEGLKEEIILYRDRFDPFDTLYVGGGTPTSLDPGMLKRLMGYLLSHLKATRDPEVTVEANPQDLTREMIAALKGSGVNRVNVGVQSFDDGVLSLLGRNHRAEDGARAIEGLRRAGFGNMGIDLIYGIEGQDLKAWLKTLGTALSFQPEHISCYELTFERKTPFARLREEGRIAPMGESEATAFFLETSGRLEDAGYIHYEISNFARGEGYFSRHNQKYWHHVPYLGLGPSAHSFQDGRRWWNLRSIRGYFSAAKEGRPPVEGREDLTREQLRMETLATGLRTKAGVHMALIRELPGWAGAVSGLQASGLVKVLEDRLIPTKRGFLVADQIPLAFFQ
ncbi:MAG: radical SAM family heme chaperone HemW [Deltaproteobacteria bacterium]|nr:radical SAM family heme chaperone HemW [Deltaproteobacteria bacterium]MBW2049009.1 radical SAM family heme chaperone HemW [Deltaproteobacteria bacterium]MBW2111827.1 radical SAM family heme chaperone HemW [Deltaproteobacteria bacterium]MBW2354103.1 radical SAM family heme chaperone HemW [Deltaproteobacteria bacterium]HDZ91118.1 radical SAM family heme chaperone HemW [Deltaproteobacteria bacterium]